MELVYLDDFAMTTGVTKARPTSLIDLLVTRSMATEILAQRMREARKLSFHLRHATRTEPSACAESQGYFLTRRLGLGRYKGTVESGRRVYCLSAVRACT